MLQPSQHGRGALQVSLADCSLSEPFYVLAIHANEAIAQIVSLIGELNADRAEIMNRALRIEVAVFDHLFDVIGDIRPKITASKGQLTDRHLSITDVEQHQCLHVINVVDPEIFELKFYDLKQVTVQALG